MDRRGFLFAVAAAFPLEAAPKKRKPVAPPIRLEQPIIPDKPLQQTSLEHMLDTTGNPVTALQHRLFIGSPAAGRYAPANTIEHLPWMDERISLAYDAFTKYGSDQLLFFNDYTPVAMYTLPAQGAVREQWKRAPDLDKRNVTLRVARQVADVVKREQLLADVSFTAGSKDILEHSHARMRQYAPYFRALAASFGLDERIAAISLQETYFTPEALGPKMRIATRKGARFIQAEGAFQLLRADAARPFGLVVPPGDWGGNDTQVNESLHPLLAAEAAFPLINRYAHHTGGLIPGISAYHTGPGNIALMRAFILEHPKLMQEELKRMAVGDIAVPDSLIHQAAMMLSWQHPDNKSGYKYYSANYVPKTIALMAGMPSMDAAAAFSADRVRIEYATTATKSATLKGSQVAALFQSPEQFRSYNPHIPLSASIPHNTRVFLPRNHAGKFFDRFKQVHATPPVIYERGTITPAPSYGPFTQADREYSELVRKRFEGRYAKVSKDAMEKVCMQMEREYERDPSAFRQLQRITAKQDCDMFGVKSYQHLMSIATLLGR